jgi:X-Pro dipeptidyl-peptidase
MRVLVATCALALVLAGCFGGSNKPSPVEPPSGASETPVAQRPVLSNSFTSYLHNLSVPMVGVNFTTAIIEQYRTPISELMELDTWIARPNAKEPVPVVLEVTPYYGGGKPASLGRVGTELIQRGFAVGVSSVRGTGESGGCFSQGGPEEAKDTARVIEHIASQTWSNGNIGLMGVSYPGTTPQDVWVEAPPALKTIVPISGISDMYKYNFVNGVHIEPQGYAFNAYYWALVGASPVGLSGGAANNPVHTATAAAGEACAEQVYVQEGGFSSGLDGNKDDYWQIRDFHKELRDSWSKNPQRASVWYIHGLQDWNVKPHNMEDWLPAIQESGVPYKVWIGQWAHAWPASTGLNAKCEYNNDTQRGASCRADWWSHGLVAWFDHFLKGIDTGILDAPRVQVQDDDGRWFHEQAWPPQDPARHTFRLTERGELNVMGSKGSITYHDGLGAFNGAPNVPPTVATSTPPLEFRWYSEPVSENWTISGMPVFHANVTSSGARANMILTLGEQRQDQSFRAFNFCAQSLNHVANIKSGNLNIAGLRQEVTLNCFPQADVLHAGSRLVLIASGNTVGSPSPGFQPLTYGSAITIEMEGAWIELPVDHSIVYENPQPYHNLFNITTR